MDAGVQSYESRLQHAFSQLIAAQAQLVDLVAEAAETGAWEGAGIRSLVHYLTWQGGLSPRSARELVAVASARATHPVTTALLAEGRATLDQTAVAVTAPADTDTQVANLVPHATVVQLRTIVRAAGGPATSPKPEPAESFDHHVDDDGTMNARFRLEPDHAQEFTAALGAARDRLFRGGQEHVTWVDALMEVVRSSHHAQPMARRERFRPNVFFDLDDTARWTDGTAVPDWLRQHVTCDGTLTPVFVKSGVPVSVGRAQRTVPDRTRRLVLQRDHGQCRSPWCSNSRWLHVHHLVHWEHGGSTDTANLAALCPTCHRELHRGRFTIAGDADRPDGLTFTDELGGDVTRPPPRGPTMPPPRAPRAAYQHPTGERLHTRWLHFTRADKPPWAA